MGKTCHGWARTVDIEHLYIDKDSPFAAFGEAIAISGDGNTALIGAPHGNTRAPFSGRVLSFEKINGTWKFIESLYPQEIETGDRFGQTVSLNYDGTLVVIGAPNRDMRGVQSSGSVFVFEKTDVWNLQQRLPWDMFYANARFGATVSINDSGTMIVASAPGFVRPMRGNGGVFLFSEETGWDNVEKIIDKKSTGEFGAILDTHGDGGFFISLTANRVLEYCLDGGVYLANELDIGVTAHSMCVSETGDRMLLGFYGRDGLRGGVDVYEKFRGAWELKATLVARDLDEQDVFGSSVACNGDGSVVVIGAPGRPSNFGINYGKAYVFVLEGGVWAEMYKLEEEDETIGNFGTTVTINRSGDEIFVSNTFYCASLYESGKVSVFRHK